RASEPGRLDSATEHLTGEVAGAGPAVPQIDVRRQLCPADRLRVRTARVERASGWNPGQVRRQPLDCRQFLAAVVEPRNRREQALGIRMSGRGVEGEDVCMFDD